ncbi:hypothetical protein ACTXT7_000724 [Hymenolepis weldensis]
MSEEVQGLVIDNESGMIKADFSRALRAIFPSTISCHKHGVLDLRKHFYLKGTYRMTPFELANSEYMVNHMVN